MDSWEKAPAAPSRVSGGCASGPRSPQSGADPAPSLFHGCFRWTSVKVTPMPRCPSSMSQSLHPPVVTRVHKMRPWHHSASLSKNAMCSATSLSSLVPARPRCATAGQTSIWLPTSLPVNGDPTVGPGSSGPRWPRTRTKYGERCGTGLRGRSSSKPCGAGRRFFVLSMGP